MRRPIRATGIKPERHFAILYRSPILWSVVLCAVGSLGLWGSFAPPHVVAQSTLSFPAPGTSGGAIVPNSSSATTTSTPTSPGYSVPDYFQSTLDGPVTSSGTISGTTISGAGTSYPGTSSPSNQTPYSTPAPPEIPASIAPSSTSSTSSTTSTTPATQTPSNESGFSSFFSDWTQGSGASGTSTDSTGTDSTGTNSTGTLLLVGDPKKPAFSQFTISGRHENTPQITSETDPQSGEQITIVTGGVNLVIQGFESEELTPILASDILDLSAENVVIWTHNDFQTNAGVYQFSPDTPLEIYLSGDIEFRTGDTCIVADRMYMDVQKDIGAIMNAEMVTPIPGHDVKARFYSDILRMTGKGTFSAGSSFLTTSLLGMPRYRIQVGSADLVTHQIQKVDEQGRLVVDESGSPKYDQDYEIQTRNNAVYVGPVPVFWAPRLSAHLNRNDYYLKRFRVRSDGIFGTQIDTSWDMYQLLGLSTPPKGTDWELGLNYMTKRGLLHGTGLSWDNTSVDSMGLLNGTMNGLLDFRGIYDTGKDDLSIYRKNMEPAEKYRYRLLGQHRQTLDAADWLGGDIQFSAEVGWSSDRYFLQQYYPNEWDERKNETTDLELKRMIDNRSMMLRGQVRLNDFVTETQWYPKFDHYWLGQNVGNALTWSEHTSLGYGDIKVTEQPTAAQNPDDVWRYLPWEIDSAGNPLHAHGGRFVTRHELAWPIQLGAIKATPYLLGEAGYWGEDMSDDDLSRLVGQIGLRATLPITGVNPDIRSQFWNLNGIAHKITLDVHGFYADASQNLDEMPLYDRLDDDSVEAFRRRMVPYIFPYSATLVPDPSIAWKYDIRSYALRSGMQSWVTAPSMEIADDLFLFQVAVNQRFQTQRGGVKRQRTVDWFRFDTRISLFPKKESDNFDELVGLLDYQSRWQVGDRLAFTSVGMFDFFSDPLQFATIGAESTRANGDEMYLGLHWLGGPGTPSTTLIGSYNYRMTDCWRSEFTMTMNIEKASEINQSFDLIRRGESFEILGGFSYNYATEVWGMHFGINPVALAKSFSDQTQTTALDVRR